MGIKKNTISINEKSDLFISWLKKRNVESLDIYVGLNSGFEYYRSMSGFVDSNYFSVYIYKNKGREVLDCSYATDYELRLIIDKFLNSIK